MILSPVKSGVTDHGILDGLADDDHTQYHAVDSNRGLDEGIMTYVSEHCYFIESNGKVRQFVSGEEVAAWDV